ncbi:AAA family ATPase [Algoriphagus machipongonensis]|uniref:Methanol dehydrogenase regulatory protein n=1 Tax=Algoriphagus machipongonensis TaxID=388413 RepID=A3HYT5_9BACT|nr:MoxR family ATPase [Algoriphagus machipongonensis]EAZ80421.1 putative methanol dehydrogenase regulatory protein [Algoriphagus machipongonensis]
MEEISNPQDSGNPFGNRLPVEQVAQGIEKVRQEIKKTIVGQDEMIELMIVGLLSKGHILLDGVPGIAKTLTSKLFAKSVNTGYSRIQFTPDLMPADVLGTSVFNSGNFEFKKGPIFSNIILIDEINRAPAKTQSAMFEVMEERQVTMDGHTYPMAQPFMVLATQNPIDSEGTYRLPEAQLDRFLFKIHLDLPNLEEEILILKNRGSETENEPNVVPAISGEDVLNFQKWTSVIRVEEKLIQYIATIVVKTRNHPSLYAGASPRASLAIFRASQAFAVIEGRDFVIPEDIKRAAIPAMRHRIILNPEKEMEGISPDLVLEGIIQSIEIPR